MESAVVMPERRRGRKRKKHDSEDMMVDGDRKKKVVVTRSLRLVGSYVRKEFEGSGAFLGKIMSYDSGLYRVNYDDGDFEDLDSGEVKVCLVEDCDLNGEWSERRVKLDKLLLDKDVNDEVLKVEKTLEPENVNQVGSSLLSEQRNGEAGVIAVVEDQVGSLLLSEKRNGEAGANVVVEDVGSPLLSDKRNSEVSADVVVEDVGSLLLSERRNADADVYVVVEDHDDADGSSNDSCEDTQEGDDSVVHREEPLVPPPELPTSSGHIGVPEESVSHLFSVYSFLRSFSIPLFLYPFGLDDFVGALNCSVENTLLDTIHVALLHVLKCHIGRLSSEGSEIALKCMRFLDWNLLDNLTWPICLVHYLMAMGYNNEPEWKEFNAHSFERDYYTLSAGKKLAVLQILCDDLLDSEELRAEMDMREESEVGIDVDTSTIVKPTGASRRFHPRYITSSAPNFIEAVKDFAEHPEIKSSLVNHSTQVGGTVESSAAGDGNGDECRICGMDGLLLCCDGCPLSYHSRCIGLNKMHMPEGSWYCPECEVNATEPRILLGTILRGGRNFGVDPYGQHFVATCDHLLVLNASIDSGICLRYYNRVDIPRVLHALCLKVEHVAAYMEICQGVMQYWQLSEENLPRNEISELGAQLENGLGGSVLNTHFYHFSDNSVAEMTEVENSGSCVTTISAADMAASNSTNCVHEPVLIGNSLDTVTKSVKMDNTGHARQQSGLIMTTMMVQPTSYIGLIGHPADTNELSQQSTSNVAETVSYTTENCSFICKGPGNGASSEAKISHPCLELNNRVHIKSYENPCDGSSYTGSSFKTNSYINNYFHGDFAASAAANFAILLSEENQVSESRSSTNRRRVISDNVSLQVKAFSSASTRFFWPNSEKKLVDIPRERCSWCFSCKTPVASKRGCLLNAAASISTRGAMKALVGGCSVKSGNGRLAGIASYIMFMEESLSGLVVGPFLNDSFRKRWRKQVEDATTCNAIKILFLELEENVRSIAFSGDWIKLVDGCPNQFSTSQVAANAAGSTQKGRPGRRGRKPSTVVEAGNDNCQDMSTDFTWWRGGALSKLIFQRGILPCSMIRKAARQGGSKKITGIHYVEGQETPKTSRQLIWRSAVEMSRNTAHLALQVRYLDFHVRWSDLVRPEQNPPDGKVPDAEASAFRNASICNKKIMEHEIRYCVTFGSQKHLPSRLMKNVAEVEQILDDGKEQYWFSGTRIPLYLIKEYEGKVGTNKPLDMSKLQLRRQKGSRKNIFSYLSQKQDNLMKTNCPLCHHDVLYRDAVKCTSCQGFCHEQCTTSSTVHKNEEVEFLTTCKHCFEAQALTQVHNSYGSPTSPLLLQGRDLLNATTARKRGKLVGNNKGPSASVRTTSHSSEMKSSNGSATAKKSDNKNWGLIWKKKNCEEDTGIDFRLKNILMRGNPDMHLTRPVCRLCNMPYNPDLMYIRCEACKHWVHGDALEVDESQIFHLLGFKCSRCRRIRNPVCPYLDPEKKKALGDKLENKAPKLDIYETDSYSQLSELLKEEFEQCTNKPEVDYELNNSNISHSGPQKLPIRRHIKRDNDIQHCSPLPDPSQVNVSTAYETNAFNSTEKLPIRRNTKKENNSDYLSTYDSFQAQAFPHEAQWDDSKASVDDGIMLDYDTLGFDDMDFEPQTFFSFNELLESDERGPLANGNVPLENSPPVGEKGMLEIMYDEQDPVVSIGTNIDFIPCFICSHSEPYPDLSCQTCGVWIHSHCSPWLESESSCWEIGWRCGNCREWS